MGPQPVNMEEWGVTKGTYAAEFPIFLSNAKERVDLRPISLHPKITEPTSDEYIHRVSS